MTVKGEITTGPLENIILMISFTALLLWVLKKMYDESCNN